MNSAGLLRGLRQRLHRETADGSFIPEIDGLRFIAIVGVVLYHLQDYVIVKTGRSGESDYLALLLNKGHIGVPLFFAISGFIIARPFLNGTAPSLGRYFLRRLTRLEPPYVINLLLVYALLVAVLGADPAELFPHLLASVAYLHNVLFGAASKINFLAWSLEVEFQFYILAPAILAGLNFMGAWGRRLALVSLVFAGGWAYMRDPLDGLGIGPTLARYFAFFSCGILAADVYVALWREKPPRSVTWDLIAFAGWAGLLLILVEGSGWWFLVPCAIFVALLGSLGGHWSSRILSWTPVFLIGGMCYTLYLYHFLIISLVGRFVLPWLDPSYPLWLDIFITMTVVIPAVFSAGAVIFVTTEKPFMHWRREGHRPKSTRVASTAGVSGDIP